MPTQAAPVLAAEGLGCRVARGWLFQALSFALAPGTCLALVAASGTGKTLLMRLLAGLDPLQAGEVRLQGKAQQDWFLPAYRARVMFLHQRAALGEATVQDSLKAPFALRQHRQRRFQPEQALAMAAALGQEAAFLGLPTASLSGGEAQLAALMRALLLEPQVLLLDEATSALDPETARRAESLVRGWLEARPERACLWASHDAGLRERVASRELSLPGRTG